MGIFRKVEKQIEKTLTRLSTCPSCGHSSAARGCQCPRTDCACDTPHNR